MKGSVDWYKMNVFLNNLMKEENKRILSRVTTPFHLLSLSYRLGFGPRRVIAIS